ncbi:SUMF1/EgtB/PvdO family nonheme iron enzyme [Vibrio sp. B1Z05]|uniref:formylglycine-generating enzyme family protein n=1 Tax=Vibrio sp. B1Z05 TaxID=2654980 RepID=UPI00128CEB0C|nr:SUMF1/EgtB/PvdO family nonheme iron enzyme [Vibrio sp. B1Z05]MPW35845.1 SUMF1/EgtB/PvdO family nonheme iron enzyme [Vibrio sp. B1Z05]
MNLPLKNSYSLLAWTLVLTTTGCSLVEPHPLTAQIEADMVLVEGGTFVMGSDSLSAHAAEKPAHSVRVDSFYIAKYEVTQALFEEVMGHSRSFFQDPQVPVNNLSWQQAYFFVQRLNEVTGQNYRLPTEAEWEFAAKGGNYSKGYTYSGSNNIDEVAWHAGNANNQAHRVGQKKPNELGLYDMTGNVGEFTIDAFEETYYRNSPQDNPNNAQHTDIKLAHKSVRGGSFAYSAEQSENFRRDFASQSITMSDMGLRLVRSAH